MTVENKLILFTHRGSHSTRHSNTAPAASLTSYMHSVNFAKTTVLPENAYLPNILSPSTACPPEQMRLLLRRDSYTRPGRHAALLADLAAEQRAAQAASNPQKFQEQTPNKRHTYSTRLHPQPALQLNKREELEVVAEENNSYNNSDDPLYACKDTTTSTSGRNNGQLAPNGTSADPPRTIGSPHRPPAMLICDPDPDWPRPTTEDSITHLQRQQRAQRPGVHRPYGEDFFSGRGGGQEVGTGVGTRNTAHNRRPPTQDNRAGEGSALARGNGNGRLCVKEVDWLASAASIAGSAAAKAKERLASSGGVCGAGRRGTFSATGTGTGVGLGSGGGAGNKRDGMGCIKKKSGTRGTEGGLKYICDVCSADITSTVSCGILSLRWSPHGRLVRAVTGENDRCGGS